MAIPRLQLFSLLVFSLVALQFQVGFSRLTPAPQSNPLLDTLSSLKSRFLSFNRSDTLKTKFVAPSGPNPGGNSKTDSIGSKLVVNPFRNRMVAPSGPNPGGNSKTDSINDRLVAGKAFVQNAKAINLGNKMPKSDTPNPGPSKDHNSISNKAVTVLNTKLPKNTPTPGSGSNPGHNSVSRVSVSPTKVACTNEGKGTVFAAATDMFIHN